MVWSDEIFRLGREEQTYLVGVDFRWAEGWFVWRREGQWWKNHVIISGNLYVMREFIFGCDYSKWGCDFFSRCTDRQIHEQTLRIFFGWCLLCAGIFFLVYLLWVQETNVQVHRYAQATSQFWADVAHLRIIWCWRWQPCPPLTSIEALPVQPPPDYHAPQGRRGEARWQR